MINNNKINNKIIKYNMRKYILILVSILLLLLLLYYINNEYKKIIFKQLNDKEQFRRGGETNPLQGRKELVFGGTVEAYNQFEEYVEPFTICAKNELNPAGPPVCQETDELPYMEKQIGEINASVKKMSESNNGGGYLKLISDNIDSVTNSIINMGTKISNISNNIEQISKDASRYVNDSINEKDKANFTTALEKLNSKYTCMAYNLKYMVLFDEEDKKKCKEQGGGDDINKCAKTPEGDITLCDDSCNRKDGDCLPKVAISNTYFQKYKNANKEQCNLYVTNPIYCDDDFRKWLKGDTSDRIKAKNVMLLVDENNNVVSN